MVLKTIDTEKKGPIVGPPVTIERIGSTHRLIVRTHKSDPFLIDYQEIPAESFELRANHLMRL